MITVDPSKCTRCGRCIADCIVQVIHMDKNGVPAIPEQAEQYCMGCQHCLAVCPAAALVCDGHTPENCVPAGPLPDESRMMNLIRQRRSVRNYRPENLPPETMTKLLDSLRWIPTGCNDHRLAFTVIDDKAKMEPFRARMRKITRFLIKSGIMRIVYPGYKRFEAALLGGRDFVFRGAPHMIVVASPKDAPCGKTDVSIALTQFDLYAQSLGVATCWCGFAYYAFTLNRGMRNLLRLPKGYRVGAVMLFGPPAVTYPRATDPEPYTIIRP